MLYRVICGREQSYTYYVVEANSREEARKKVLSGYNPAIAFIPEYVEVVEAEDCGDGVFYIMNDAPIMPSAAAAALGSITSPAKAKASRANGKKGGRPRKKKAE